MAEPISIQQLKDASLDAKTLEEAVNGDAITTVLSRLGETYPTLSNALNQIDSKLDSADTQIKQGITSLFENGGLPATPFKTKALMTASSLANDKYAMVTDDSVAANNGLYVKTAGAWVKSGYDPTALANTYTDNKVKGVTNNFKTKALMSASALPNDSYAMVTDDTEANNGWYSKVAGEWVKSAYNPVLTTLEIVDNKLDGFVEYSKNLYNNDYYNGYLINAAGQVIYDQVIVKRTALVFIEIEPQKTYTVKKYEGGRYLRLITVNNKPNHGDIPINETPSYSYFSETSSAEVSHTFKNTADAKYLVIGVLSNISTYDKLPRVMVNEGSVSLPFSDYSPVKIKEGALGGVSGKLEAIDALAIKSDNLYKEDIYTNLILIGATAQVEYISSSNAKVGFFPMLPNETYTVTAYQGGDQFRLAAVNSKPEVVDSSTKIATEFTLFSSKAADQVVSYTYTNYSGAKYLALSFNSNTGLGVVPKVSIVRGSFAPDAFEEYGVILQGDFLGGSDYQSYFEERTTQVNPEVLRGIGVDTFGQIISGSHTLDSYSIRIPVKFGDVLDIEKVTGNRFGIGESYVDSKDILEKGLDGIYSNTYGIISNVVESTSPSRTRYEYRTTDKRVKEVWLYVQSGVIEQPPVFNITAKSMIVVPKEDNIVFSDGLTDIGKEDVVPQSTSKKVSGDDIVRNSLTNIKDFLTYDDIKGYNSVLNSTPITDLYGTYDALVADFPDYVSREVLYTDVDGVEMRLYKFLPTNPVGAADSLKKVLLVSGMHGDEKAATLADSNLMNNIARHWSTHHILADFRLNYEFYVIPVVNTTGYVDNTRFTREDVNLNREFAADDLRDWADRSPEIKPLNDVITARSYDLCIDHHTDSIDKPNGRVAHAWIITTDAQLVSAFSKVMSDLRLHWSESYSEVRDIPLNAPIWKVESSRKGTLGDYMGTIHPKSATVETMNDYYIRNVLKRGGDHYTQLMTAEIIGNVTYSFMNKPI